MVHSIRRPMSRRAPHERWPRRRAVSSRAIAVATTVDFFPVCDNVRVTEARRQPIEVVAERPGLVGEMQPLPALAELPQQRPDRLGCKNLDLT